MHILRNPLLFSLAVILSFGCSKVGFQSLPDASCTQFEQNQAEGSCVMTPDGLNTYKFPFRSGKIDVLFVVDNSASMYVEQQKIAGQFPDFLDSLRKYDYQIAIITTDISNSPNNSSGSQNGNGAYWDGQFIKFPNGQNFLSNPDASASVHNSNINHFQKSIQRPETLKCDDEDKSCPSSDERAIYALNMALDRSENSFFFRPGSHLAVIIISDEDERTVAPGQSTSLINKSLNPDLYNMSTYRLQSYDLPQNFVVNFNKKAPSTSSLSVHSIIIKPKVARSSDGKVIISRGDSQGEACFDEQNAQKNGLGMPVKGFFGTQYAILSVPSKALKKKGNIVDGHLGNLCANNYTQQMGPISQKITGLDFVQLPCAPVKDTVKIELNPKPSFNVDYAIDSESAARLIFSPKIPPGTDATIEFKCRRSK